MLVSIDAVLESYKQKKTGFFFGLRAQSHYPNQFFFIYHQRGTVSFILLLWSIYQLLSCFEIYTFEITTKTPRGEWANSGLFGQGL